VASTRSCWEHSPEHVLAQIRAEVLQQVTVDTLDEAGVGALLR
jgi:hypothetical protein